VRSVVILLANQKTSVVDVDASKKALFKKISFGLGLSHICFTAQTVILTWSLWNISCLTALSMPLLGLLGGFPLLALPGGPEPEAICSWFTSLCKRLKDSEPRGLPLLLYHDAVTLVLVLPLWS